MIFKTIQNMFNVFCMARDVQCNSYDGYQMMNLWLLKFFRLFFIPRLTAISLTCNKPKLSRYCKMWDWNVDCFEYFFEIG